MNFLKKETFLITLLVMIWSTNALTESIPSITRGYPKGSFGDGEQTNEVTEPEQWRWAELYYGFIDIDAVKQVKDGCGQDHLYAVGEHQCDLIEFLMRFGGDYNRLTLRGIADNPGPVEVDIYIDAEYQATASWDNSDGCNQDVSVDISGIPLGTHAIAVEFINDLADSQQNLDRNFYLDGLLVTRSVHGQILRVASDASWKSTDSPSEGWQTTDFDDSAWAYALAPYPNKINPNRIIYGTQAKLMWHYPYPSEPDGESGPDEAWFRKTFSLPLEAEDIIKAGVTAAADDDFDLYVNGTLVISDWDGVSWTGPFTADIKPHLIKGENVLAVHARDSYGNHEWLLVEVSIEHSTPSTKPPVKDRSAGQTESGEGKSN